MRCVQMLPVVKDFLAPNGEWVLDFGQNITGVVHAKLDLPAGAQVRRCACAMLNCWMKTATFTRET